MQITNHTLRIDGHEPVELPHLGRAALVRAWAVPADYRDSGLFVSVVCDGEAYAVPACAQGDAEFLGECVLDPHPETLAEAQMSDARARIDAEFERRLRALYSIDDELYFGRICVGVALGTYEFRAGEQALIAEYQRVVESLRDWKRAAKAALDSA